jgi:serpin B
MKGIQCSRKLLAVITTAAACICVSAVCAIPSPDQQKLASANTDFAFKLLQEIAREQPGTNIFISPLSASSVLQMACNGAAGRTKTEMQRVLGTTNLQPAALDEAYKDIQESLNNRDTNVILTTANALWYRKGTPVKPEFLASCQRSYGATIDGLNFDDPHSIEIMNGWASEKTRGKINGIADGLVNRLTQLFLANAVYFKGKWEEPFDVKNTKDRVFHLRGAQQKKVPMMEQTRRFTYRRGTGYQAVRMAYQGWSLGMYIFLPDPSSSPEKLVGLMNGDTWRRITKPGFNEQQGTVAFPKFRIEYAVELKQPLKSLGMKSAFAEADLSGMSNEPLVISAVRQRTFVEVNEEGTEAAAATAVAADNEIELNPPKPFQMIVERPFLFLIEDMETNTILFMGIVFDPSAGS